MNDLSWFLYLADVAQNLKSALVLGGSIALIGAIATAPFWLDEDFAGKHGKRYAMGVIFIAPVVLLLAMLLPSANTMYAIAASELGEQAVMSDTGKKIANALEAWLDKQLEQVGK